ncbi:hypothetical protein D3C80_1595630 [compost metagenome]
MDLLHGLVEHLPQLAQLVAALRLETDRHIAGRDFIHDLAEALQGGPGRHIEGAIEVADQQEHQHQGHDQQDHLHAVFLQAFLQLLIEESQYRIIQLIGLAHGRADFFIELRPGSIQSIGDHHLVLEQHHTGLQGRLAGCGQGFQPCARSRAAAQGVLQVQAILGVEFFQLQQ